MKYLIFGGGALFNRTVFLILFLDRSLLLYKIQLIFIYWSHIQQPCWTCLLVLVGFFVDSLWFSTYRIMSSVNNDNFTSFRSSNQDAFILSFFFPIPLERYSSAMLNRSGKISLISFLILKGKYSVFHQWVC